MEKENIVYNRVWFITGASKGFGRALVEAALEQGDMVVATARKPEILAQSFQDNNHLLILPLDVTNSYQIQESVEKAIEKFGHIDILVNNAGYGLLGAVEEANLEEVKQVFSTNVFGLHAVTQSVLPHLRSQRSGHIINISSVGGFSGSIGWGIYNSTKFAVKGLSEALSLEVKPLGIHVTIVEPGMFRTDFLASSMRSVNTIIKDYTNTSGQTRETANKSNGSQPGDPKKAASAILKVVAADDPPLRLVLGSDSLKRIKTKLEQVKTDLNNWQTVTLSTNIEDEQIG
ncbi:short-chain dehydrogenase/reductase [Bacillus cereus]|uniref:oxidoreductase n=1 Tax=Bacillus sp. AFS023182 TaxID=2033492 RepID=UPI000BF8A939|nr:oxidoreductase [Bacillus sp. AFS023182]PFD91025.1 short-chain dehydrogenase/reductase [Bacillus sp. AFS023182]PGY03470.1 short-chain dehydrogenase/reductase [Bacillus cereus]